MRWFRGAGENRPKTASAAGVSQRIRRRSTGFTEFTRSLSGSKELSILDLGPTSAANISFLTGYGGRAYTEDLLRSSANADYRKKVEGSEVLDVEKFLVDNLNHPEHFFDAVLCWDVFDYLDESLVKPAAERLAQIVKPKGVLLAFFHTQDAGPDYPYSRYHIAESGALELEPTREFGLKRVFNNRHIEGLFKGFSSVKFFLARDHVREVLAVR
ncbi:MAG TPA: methyltransferase domain-containing protein [Candidatus Angelobacter sp.]|nr:methyltransferase domain-containing protein [Candidatus Angelobacter sp.]